jgi:DNA-binding transcriptional LysR family regulator
MIGPSAGRDALDIQDFRIFARVAAVQNLSQVGTELGLTPGTISKRLQALEDELGVRLFDRTTRSIRITDEGTSFLAHVEKILYELESARAVVGNCVTRPKGRLKVAAPASLARRLLAPAICQFVRQHPEVEMQVDLSDRNVNLQEDGYDVAIRVGLPPDSSMIAKRLAADPQVLVAAPAYIEEHGAPKQPEDLTKHSCLVLGETTQWPLTRDGREIAVRVAGRLKSNSIEFLLRAAAEGEGIALVPEATVADDLAAGRLVRVLPRCEVNASAAIWAVYPTNKHVLPKLRVLLDFLGDWFRESRSDILGNGGIGHVEHAGKHLDARGLRSAAI